MLGELPKRKNLVIKFKGIAKLFWQNLEKEKFEKEIKL